VVVREFISPSYKFLLAKEEGGGKYQQTQGNEATRQQGSQTTKGGEGGQKVFRNSEMK
jgi:hypothetical protein